MADRHSQYSMVPHGFNQNNMRQPQQQQSDQPVPGFNNTDNNRMWQQMHQMQQMQGFRPQIVGDIVPDRQLADLIKSQNIARAGQHQMGFQQSFGIGGGPTPNSGQSQSQNSFLEASSSQPNQAHMSSNFPNIPNMANAAQMQPSFATRNAMMQAFQSNNYTHMRQLELMNLAQNQQPQSSPANMAARLAQHQANANGQRGFYPLMQSDLFSNFATPPVPEMHHNTQILPTTHPTGFPGGNQQPMHPNGLAPNGMTLPAGRRAMTLAELKERAQSTQQTIVSIEQDAVKLQNSRPGMPDALFSQKMQHLQQEIASKKELLKKITSAIQAMAQQPAGSNAGHMNNMNGQIHPQANNGLTAWPPQPNLTQTHGFGGPTMSQGHSHLQNHGLSPAQNIQSSPSPLQGQKAQISSQNFASPRTAPMPHQLQMAASPNPSNPPPFQTPVPGGSAMPQQNQQQLQQNQVMGMLRPLEKAQFETAYRSFCSRSRITHDPRVLTIDNRSIDLHSLHVYVMQEGGMQKVSQKDLWGVIGGKMGFVQFPGTEAEPARSGPAAALHLQNVYKEYLFAFDTVYVHTVFENKKKQMQQQQSNGQPPQPPNMQGPQNVAMSRAQMVQVIQYANVSAAEMRTQGVPEKLIEFVENHRATLQRTLSTQMQFRDTLAKQPSNRIVGQPSEQQAVSANVTGQFDNTPAPPPFQQNPSMQGSMPSGMHVVQAPPHQSITPAPSHTPDGNALNAQFNHRPPSAPMHGMASNTAARPSFLATELIKQEHLQHAMQVVTKAKHDFATQHMPSVPFINVPDDQRVTYNSALERLHRGVVDIDSKLPMIYVLMKQDETFQKLIAISLTVQRQRSLLSSATPKYILELSMIQKMAQQLQMANEAFQAALQHMRGNLQLQKPLNGQPPQSMNLQRPQPQQLPVPQPPQPVPPPVPRPATTLNSPPARKKPQPPIPGPSKSPAAAATPTPPFIPSVSTPIANVTTPTMAAASPHSTPKSPKGKAAVKSKPPAPKRKVSKVVAPQAESTPSTSSSTTVKRAREDETSNEGVSNAESPPKKIKSEWDGPPDPALEKKQEDIDNIKTEEQASQFLMQMTELIKLAEAEGQESITSDISDTLDMILKGCGSFDPPETSDSLVSIGLGNMGREPSPPSTHMPATDEFIEFFDFSSYTNPEDDEAGSKPPTPDLLPSTGPSPESGSEADAAAHAISNTSVIPKPIDIKSEDSSLISDSLRLGLWKEIDGGESAHYQATNWKWDTPMPHSDQAWAIFNS